jgi:hypothetical protein
MAGRVVVSTLNDDTGVLATQNGMTGIAKAWVNFNGTGTVAIRDSFNVSSITDNGAGDYTVNFTTAMPNVNYCAVATVSANTIASGSVIATGPFQATPTTSAYRFVSATSSAVVDCLYASVAVFSS